MTRYLKILPLLFFFLVAFLDILFINRNLINKRKFTKPLIIPFLLMYFLFNAKTINVFIPLSLIFSTLGDTFLLFRKNRRFLLLGLFSFFLTHIFYILLFLETIEILSIPAWSYLFLPPYFIIGVMVFRMLDLKEFLLAISVIIYMLAIVTMNFLSFLRFFSVPFNSFILIFLGSLLFIISDSLLSLRYFGEKKIRGEFVTISYILAQFLIVLGFIH